MLVLKAFRRGFRAPGVGGFVNFLRRWGGSVISGILPTRHSGRGASTVGRGCNWARSERGWDAWVGIVLVSWRSGEFGGGFSILWEVEVSDLQGFVRVAPSVRVIGGFMADPSFLCRLIDCQC